MRTYWQKPKGGFSAIEILLVIAVIAILLGIAFLSYSKYLERAERAALKTSVNSTSAAVMMCNSDGEELNDPQAHTNQPICDNSSMYWPDLAQVVEDAAWGGCETFQDGDHFRYCAVLGASTTISCTEYGCHEQE